MIEQLAEMPTYEAYKDSGVEWLGEIPAHWNLTRLSTRFEERRQKVSDKDFPPLSVTKNGILPQLDTAAKTNDGDNRKLVKKGDFVINSRSDRKGSSGVSDRDGSVSLINIVLMPNGIDSQYCNFLLKSYAFIEEFYRMGHGIVADLWTTRYDEMKAVILGIPPLPEQTAIAFFLDRKTVQIDQAVAIKEQQIALLKEHKQILIQNAVTRGLDANVTMRDSGVEWIGEIPAHWEVIRFKYCCTIASGQVDPRKEPFSSMVLIAPNHIESATGKLLLLESAISQGADSGKYQVCKGNLIYSKIRPGLRKVCISPVDGLCSADMYALRPKSELNSIYLLFYILTDAFSLPALDAAMRVAMPKVNREALGDFPVLMPSEEEQSNIVAHIETQSAKIDQAIAIQQQQIDKLKEYKATLINSAVTGKIKVTELGECKDVG
jgi:type I restriction enzyme S subunit